MIEQKTVEKFLLSFDDVWTAEPFEPQITVYYVGPKAEERMFALLSSAKKPVRLSLKCDPQLSQILRDKYDEVMPGVNLNKKYWNSLVLSGQLSWEDMKGLITHSYFMAKED